MIHKKKKNGSVKDITPQLHLRMSVINFYGAYFRKMDYNKIERLPEDQFQGLVNLSEL